MHNVDDVSFDETKGSPYSTNDEIRFLARLKLSNVRAWQNYRDTFYDRENWGKLQPARIANALGLRYPKSW